MHANVNILTLLNCILKNGLDCKFSMYLPQLKIIYIRQCLIWGFIHIVAPKALETQNFSTALWKMNPRLCGLTHFPSRKPILDVLKFFNSLPNQIASESISSKLQNRAVLFVSSYPSPPLPSWGQGCETTIDKVIGYTER